MKRTGKTFRACMTLLLSLALCMSNVMFAVAQDEISDGEPAAEETAAPEESVQSGSRGDAAVTLTAEYNKVYVNIAPTADTGWTNFELTVTWDESVALKSAAPATDYVLALVNGGSGLQTNTGTTRTGEFLAGCAYTTSDGKGNSYEGAAYILEFDTEEEVTVTCGDESVVINEKPANEGDAAVTLTAKDNKVYVNVAPTAADGWTNFTLTVEWDKSAALKSASVTSEFALSLAIGGNGLQSNSGMMYAGRFIASSAFTTGDGAGNSYSGTAYVLEFDTKEELTVTCGDASVVINRAKYDVEDTGKGATIEKYTGSNTNVELPKEIDGEEVRIIGPNAFSNTVVETVVIPETVTKIEETAFANCEELTSITIPSSVTEIGENAFAGCENVTIRCYVDSAAFRYARKNSISVAVLDEFTYGDANGDDKVDANDALAALQEVVKLKTLPALQEYAVDVNGTDGITAGDALCVLQKVVKLIDTFPVQNTQK